MSAALIFDNRTFRAGLRHKLSLTKRAEADVLNNAHGDVCLTAIKYTPRASTESIRSLDPKILAAAVAKKLREQGVPLGRGRRRGVQRNAQGHFVKGSGSYAGGGIDPKDFAQEVKKERARRIRSVGNIAAGFIKAALAVGKRPKGKVSEKGNTGKGYGKKATTAKLEAFGVNSANGASLVATFAVQKAMDEVGRRMLTYAPKQIAKVWK